MFTEDEKALLLLALDEFTEYIKVLASLGESEQLLPKIASLKEKINGRTRDSGRTPASHDGTVAT